MARSDHGAAAVVLSALVRSIVDCYFARHRLWAEQPAAILSAIEAFAPKDADLLRKTLTIPLAALCLNPSPLFILVDNFCESAEAFEVPPQDSDRLPESLASEWLMAGGSRKRSISKYGDPEQKHGGTAVCVEA
jgi:hypothetical protein